MSDALKANSPRVDQSPSNETGTLPATLTSSGILTQSQNPANAPSPAVARPTSSKRTRSQKAIKAPSDPSVDKAVPAILGVAPTEAPVAPDTATATAAAMQHDVNLNDASINLGSTKNKRHQACRRGQSGKAYASQISPHGLDCRPYYRNAKNVGFELYPDIPQINKHYNCKPTPGELAAAYISVSQPGWKLFDKGLNIMFDDDAKDSRIIVIVEFVEWAEMSDKLK
ncbi:hypothetical protein PSTT_11739 [Puccinia striiformis]|uniref:Uncharacterized protein n=1 Tax=Puccinia striiformis TaxID=27350 RepID=A0A2S4UZ04_9BASI|nr:hypothetical protein PSTT_11739 [Puccinia striiformis]